MVTLLWLQGITCNGNSHSFLNYPHLKSLLDCFELLYHPLLPSRYKIEEIEKIRSVDILVVEGAPSKEWVRGRSTFCKLFSALEAKWIVAVGSCAVYGGLLGKRGLAFARNKRIRRFDNLINIPGCPAHPEWIAYVLWAIVHDKRVALDEWYRPKELFAYTVHSGCVRNEYFEWKVDAKGFGLKEGCLFYEQGCQAPYTHGSCNKILWNEVSSKTRAGMPCIGCTEPDFPKRNLFETKTYMGIPATMPLGVPKRAYLTLTGIAKSFRIERLSKRLLDED
ncbi:MAG: hydrogenase [Epsilonproteobacteria bacterium]|nr:hydrogenase [Campylobacterota bacterium]NPA64500.1 hydrogenase [Campylobacterota bacterium]